MVKSLFKTTERQRTAAQRTRLERTKVRKPQSRDVDEALSAAVAKVFKRILRDAKAASDHGFAVEMVYPKQISDWVLEVAVDHLVDVRAMDKAKSKSALQERLRKTRRYLVSAKS